jgi:signal transduction histidine kinase
MQKLKNLLREFRALRISLSLKFIIGVIVVLMIAMGVSFFFISKKHEDLVLKQIELQAKVLFKQIVLTRRWIADHGGVFVEKLPWVKPNPYLEHPLIRDKEGKLYVKKNPAMVTRELSLYAQKEGLYFFHITSLKLLNPDNAPDDFERDALHDFEVKKLKESSKIEKIGNSYYFRYIAPLYVEESCLQCHLKQGYKVGDIRGAISVAVPMDYAFSMIRSGRRDMVIAGIAILSILMTVLYIMMRELVLRPVRQLKTSMGDFSKGVKTETSVIRVGDELEDLSKAFVEMSKSLTEYHTRLQDKVRAATRSLEEVNARLTELNMKKSDFIAKVSHELRTPLTSIKGAMDYLSTKFSMGAKSDKEMNDLREFLDVIKKNADRLVKMVNDTLDLERIESGIFEMHFSRINLVSLVKEVITSFYSVASEKKITFKIVAKPDIFITSDEDRIRQVLINLISNALKVSPVNSEIFITVTESEKAVTASIKDEGPGIPAEEHEKIFEKFYTRGVKDGTGLGLTICKGIIETHGGEIKVVNNESGKGCTFYFTLPKTWQVNETIPTDKS